MPQLQPMLQQQQHYAMLQNEAPMFDPYCSETGHFEYMPGHELNEMNDSALMYLCHLTAEVSNYMSRYGTSTTVYDGRRYQQACKTFASLAHAMQAWIMTIPSMDQWLNLQAFDEIDSGWQSLFNSSSSGGSSNTLMICNAKSEYAKTRQVNLCLLYHATFIKLINHHPSYLTTTATNAKPDELIESLITQRIKHAKIIVTMITIEFDRAKRIGPQTVYAALLAGESIVQYLQAAAGNDHDHDGLKHDLKLCLDFIKLVGSRWKFCFGLYSYLLEKANMYI